MVPEEERLITITFGFDWDSSTWQAQVEEKQVQTLLVCRESRDEALRDYAPITFNDKGNYIYANWSRDTIFFDFPTRTIPCIGPILSFFRQELRMVQSLAIGLYMRPGPNFLDLLGQFNQLQRLMFLNNTHVRD
jgi:hypothetical protein